MYTICTHECIHAHVHWLRSERFDVGIAFFKIFHTSTLTIQNGTEFGNTLFFWASKYAGIVLYAKAKCLTMEPLKRMKS